MTNKERRLLLIDLCARVPYGIKVVDLGGCVFTVKGIDGDSPLVNEYSRFGNTYHTVGYGWKPYLRPMSSMTEKEKAEFLSLPMKGHSMNSFDWLNTNHFDFRGLIPMGLALEAKEDMYNIK